MSPFSERAYNYVITTKVDALALMAKADTSYEENKDDIDAFTIELEKAQAYDKTREHNYETNKMWEIVTDPNGHLLGGFLKAWKDGKTFSPMYILLKQKQIEKAFDELAALEQGKQHLDTILRY